jgi:ADP-glucose pyrophosphorylase
MASPGRVMRMRKESIASGEVLSFAYLGCALLGAPMLDALPREGCLVGDLLLPRLRSGARVEVLPFTGDWLDVGTLHAYLGANLAWLAARGHEAFVGEGALVAGAELRETVVGARARIAPGATLDRCVLWPGGEVPNGEHRECIFAPGLAPLRVERDA